MLTLVKIYTKMRYCVIEVDRSFKGLFTSNLRGVWINTVLAFVLPSFQNCLDLGIKLIIFLLGCITLFFVFLYLVTGRFRSLSDSLRVILNTTERLNDIMTRTVPRVLHGLEKKDFADSGSESELIRIMSSQYTTRESPLKLNSRGKDLLESSGTRKVIDSNLDSLIEDMEKEKLDNLLDIELRCLCVLKRKKDDKEFISAKNYAWNNSNISINNIFYVGSIYLRDKYIEKHPELLKVEELSIK